MNNSQSQLFYEDVYDVLRAAVQAAGGSKAVAAALWPAPPVIEAQRALLDCLNRERPRKLEIEEVIQILGMAREVGFHDAKHWFDNAIGYEPSAPLNPVVERDRLAQEVHELTRAHDIVAQRLQWLLEQDSKLKAVK